MRMIFLRDEVIILGRETESDSVIIPAMRRYLYMGVFLAGFASLAVELSASRLLGNYFGSSNIVWATIIGLIMIYLSIGYILGGRWADRSPKIHTFFSILCWASLLIGLIPLASRPILRAASQAFDEMNAGVMIGSFVSVIALFSLPVTLLGTASPFAIRLAIQEKEQSGTAAGTIYAISTLGSFIGTFLPVLLFIPLLGTYKTFIALSAILMTVALFGLAKTASLKSAARLFWMPVILVVSALYGLGGLDKVAQNIIYEADTAYNYIQVQEIDGYRILRLNEGQGIHSIYHPEISNYYGPWEQVLSAPFFNPAPVFREDIQRMAILGLAAGTSANQATAVFPEVHIDGYEIDPAIIQVGYDFFAMELTRMQVFAEDARWGITHNQNLYDVISIDAYKPPYIPWHLTTQEFFQVIYDRLHTDGALVINVARIFNDRRLVNGLFATISSVFPSVYIVDLPNSFNSIIFATKQPTVSDNLIMNYIALREKSETPKLLLATLELTILNIQPAPKDGQIFTDDRAPVEWITNAMIFDLLKSDQIEKIQ